MAVVTISSSYGAGGALIGPDVARRLGLQFFDRAIPIAVAHELAVAVDDALELDWRAPSRIDRVLDAIANVSMPFGISTMGEELRTGPDQFRLGTESVLRQIADESGGVILGRAAMIILAGRDDVLRVRLDGPVERRIAASITRSGLDEASVRRDQRETDTARESYSQTFYGISQSDARYYEVVLDSTVLSWEVCTDIIVTAANDRFGRSPAT
jgi:cytidylate kinase